MPPLNDKKAPLASVIGLSYLLLLAARFAEYLWLRNDKGPLAENWMHKAFGILLLGSMMVLLRRAPVAYGFGPKRRARGLAAGALLFAVSYGAAYGIEYLLASAAAGRPAAFSFYMTGFSLTGETVAQTGFSAFAMAAAMNLINVLMEEGMFRGCYLKEIMNRKGFAAANLVQAALFGAWHVAMPIRSYLDGQAGLPSTLGLCAGYVVLSFIMGWKLGLLAGLSGGIWICMAEHFLNNLSANVLHVVTADGADALQILRVFAALTISTGITVLAWAIKRRKEKAKTGASSATGRGFHGRPAGTRATDHPLA